MRPKKEPKQKIIKLKVEPAQGAAALVSRLVPPEGYVFTSMKRDNKGNVRVVYTKHPL